MTRLARLAGRLERPLLVTKLVNVRWLCGLDSSNAALLVEPSGETTLYTDFRYAEAASQVESVTFTQTKRDVVGGLAELLAGREIGIEADHVTVAAADALRAGGLTLHPDTGHVEALRMVKDAGEVAAIRRAATISDRVYGEIAELPIIGMTEAALAWHIERRFRELGASGTAFDPLVGAGEMGARPHGHPRDVPIPPGTMVVVDTGCVVDGYRSDCTRTFLTGDDQRLLDLYALCLAAQMDALAAVLPGAGARDVDAASRVQIAAAGLAEAYGHGLGHGVGLEIHEGPWLRESSDEVLVPGNVVTVEPGIYLAGDVGVRIEDLVLVTEDGAERLTTVPKEPVVVG